MRSAAFVACASESAKDFLRSPRADDTACLITDVQSEQGQGTFRRSGDTLVVRWVDRLGRNYEDICETIREFMRRGVVIRTVINGITFDGARHAARRS